MTQVAQGSSTSAEMAVAAAAQGARPGRKGLAALVEQNMDEIAKALPPGVMEPERFARIVLTEFRKTPKLLVCTPESFMGALFQTAQLGLEPGGQLGHAFLIPYDNTKLQVTECQLQIGYKGYVELGGRRGILMRAREVRKGDRFAFDLGSNEFLHHDWELEENTSRLEQPVIGFWGKVVMPDGKVTFTVMDRSEIDERKRRSSAVRSGRKGPWDTDYLAMARKTVIRAMVPQVALAPELQVALKADDAIIERGAHGDLSYLYRDAIDISTAQTGTVGPTKEDVTNALNDMSDNHQRIACSKYLLDNFGPLDQISDDAAMACLKIAQEWPAVLNRINPEAAPAASVQVGGQSVSFGPDTESILNELDDELRAQASVHLQHFIAASQEELSDDAVALELETWLNSDPGADEEPAQGAQEAAEAPDAPEGGTSAPRAQERPSGSPSQEILDATLAAVNTWPVEQVKAKLGEWGESRQGAERTLRLRLGTLLASERAKGNQAAEDLF